MSTTTFFNHAGFASELERTGLTKLAIAAAFGHRTVYAVDGWARGRGTPDFSQLMWLLENGVSLRAVSTGAAIQVWESVGALKPVGA